MRVQPQSFQTRFTRRFLQRVSEALPEEARDTVCLSFDNDDRPKSLKSLLSACQILSRGVVSEMTPLALAGAVALELVDQDEEQSWVPALEQQRSQQMPDSRDLQAQSRLDQLAQRLRPHLSQDIHFQAVQSHESNGYASPGNRVFISEDLCKHAPMETLVWLAGHEIGHVEARDSVKSYGYRTLGKLLGEAQNGWDRVASHIPFTPTHQFQARLNQEYADIQVAEESAADTRGVEFTKALGLDQQRVSEAIQEHFTGSVDTEGLILPAAERIRSLQEQLAI